MILIDIGWKLFGLLLLALLLWTSIRSKQAETHKAEADAFRKLADMKDVERDREIVVAKLGKS